MSLNAAPSVAESKHRFSLFAELRAHTGPNQPCLRLWLLINRFRLSVLRFWNTNAVYKYDGYFCFVSPCFVLPCLKSSISIERTYIFSCMLMKSGHFWTYSISICWNKFYQCFMNTFCDQIVTPTKQPYHSMQTLFKWPYRRISWMLAPLLKHTHPLFKHSNSSTPIR